MRYIGFILFIMLALCCALEAKAASQGACASPEHRQFDFWLGSWRVTDAKGAYQGTNDVTSEFGGCVVQEHWRGARGGRGSSFNTYLPERKQWQQTWVDNGGLTLQLRGGLTGHRMTLAGRRVDASGKTILDRIEWTPLRDGRVRQHWQESTDGVRWADVFDGYYTRAGSR